MLGLAIKEENDLKSAGEGQPALSTSSSVSNSKASEAPKNEKKDVENVVES